MRNFIYTDKNGQKYIFNMEHISCIIPDIDYSDKVRICHDDGQYSRVYGHIEDFIKLYCSYTDTKNIEQTY